MRSSEEFQVPKSLRTWFVIHFVLDFILAVPLIFVPELFLSALGWTTIDPIMSRLAGAAFMAIGVESLLGRNAGPEAYRAMLNLKIIWASSAVVGIAIGMIVGGPAVGWFLLVIFAAFLGLWVYYRMRLR